MLGALHILMRVPVSLQFNGWDPAPGTRVQGKLVNYLTTSGLNSQEVIGGPLLWSPKVKAGHRPTFLAVVQYVNLGSDPSGNDQCGGDRSHPPPIRLLTIWLAAVSMSSLTLVTIRPSKEQNKRETIEGPGIQQIPTEASFTNLFSQHWEEEALGLRLPLCC